MMCLITGATGEIGSRVVRLLLERGMRPRVLVRSEERARARFEDQVDVTVGDLASPDSIRAAIQGMNTVFLVNVGREIPQRDRVAATIGKELGVRKIVKLSPYFCRTRCAKFKRSIRITGVNNDRSLNHSSRGGGFPRGSEGLRPVSQG